MMNKSISIFVSTCLLLSSILSENNTYAQSGNDEILNFVKSFSSDFINTTTGTFINEVTQKKVTGSVIFISGVFEKRKAWRNPCDLLRKFLEQKGWKSDIQFDADGPDGTQYSFMKNGASCSVIGRWDGGDDSNPKYLPKDVYHIVIYYGK